MTSIQRGDLVIANLQGDYGKPRSLVIIQSDLFHIHNSITVCPITSHVADTVLRVTLIPNNHNGLKQISQVMTDKIMTIQKAKIQQHIGQLSSREMTDINQALKRWLDLG